MRYVEARLAERDLDLAYRIYVTDAIRLVSKNTGGIAPALGAQGSYMRVKYSEILDQLRNDKKPQETRTAKDVINHIRNRLRALGGD